MSLVEDFSGVDVDDMLRERETETETETERDRERERECIYACAGTCPAGMRLRC